MLRALLVVVTVGGAVLATNQLASATSASADDPEIEDPSLDPRSDITSLGASYTDGVVTFQMTTAEGDDPTSAIWADGNVSMAWGVVVDDSDVTTFIVLLLQFNGEPSVWVIDSNLDLPCLDAPGSGYSYDASTHSYQVTIPASCIGSPTSIGIIGGVEYNTDNDNDTLDYDEFPVDQICCTVTNTVTPPATTTTTVASTTTTLASTTTTTVASTTTSVTVAPAGTTTSTVPITVLAAEVTTTSMRAGTVSTGGGQLAFTGVGGSVPVLAVTAGAVALGAGVGAVVHGAEQLRRRLGHRRPPGGADLS